MKPIVIVGSINMDLVSRADRIPSPGETVSGTSFQTYSGGKGANQAVAVASLGYPAIMLGAVGEDAFGHELRQTLRNYGVVTEHITTVPGSSGTASIVVDEMGENAIIVTPGANNQVLPPYLGSKVEILRNAAMVLAQLEIPMETIEWLAQCCHSANIPLMLDPAPAATLAPSVLSKVTWFTPNEKEASFYARDSQDTMHLIETLLKQGVENVILKRGSEGSTIYSAKNGAHVVRATVVSAVDTTAAGDAFNGAFAFALASGRAIEDAARFASAAATVSVTRHGAQTSLPTYAEVDTFLMNTSSRGLSNVGLSNVAR